MGRCTCMLLAHDLFMKVCFSVHVRGTTLSNFRTSTAMTTHALEFRSMACFTLFFITTPSIKCN